LNDPRLSGVPIFSLIERTIDDVRLRGPLLVVIYFFALFVLFFFSTLENSAYNPQFSSPWPVF
jgi:hypothetical protein